MEITNQLQIGHPLRTGNVELTRTDRDLVASFFESGVALIMSNYGSHLNFRVYVPRTYENRTQGFLGNLDESPDNEFHTREDSNPVPNINTDQQIYPHLEDHCKYCVYL